MQILSEKKIKDVFRAIPEIETERLTLGKITVRDTQDMFEYSHLPEVKKFLTWAPHKTENETFRYIKLLEKKYSKGAFWDFGVRLRSEGKFIGTCGFTSFDTDTNSAEIGYVISPFYRGRGIAPEACRAVMKFGFAVFDLDYICARFIKGNDASEKVMTKLCMKYSDTYVNSYFIKGEYKTVVEYKITSGEFFASAPVVKA